jgi:methylglyoxal synthase
VSAWTFESREAWSAVASLRSLVARSHLADNPKIEYGLTCTSGPLGGDAQVAALMCMEDLGALIFFTDPLSAHPHQVRLLPLLLR